MAKILIDLLPALGHFNSSLKIVNLLRSSGHDVIYLNQGLRAELAKYELKSCSVKFDLEPVLLKGTKLKLKKLFKLLFSFKRNRYKKFRSTLKSFKLFKEFVAELAPDVVLLDEQNMLKAVYYQITGVPVITLQTKPDPCMSANIPPFTSRFIPSNQALSKCYCRYIWFVKIIVNYYTLKVLQINSICTDEYSIACRIAKYNGIDLKNLTDLKRGFGIGIKGVPRLIISPAPFDFHRNFKEYTHYLGPLIDIRREKDMRNPRFSILCNHLERLRSEKEGFVIYCSLGSVTALYHKRVKLFFNKILEVARKNTKDIFILSSGDGYDIMQIFPTPKNLFAFRHLPQSDLLGRCDIMLTHGGMNSITECVYHGVPLLVYPLSPDWDQPGNSARVVYHGMGLRGRIMTDSAKTISKKLNIIKNRYPVFREKVLQMREKCEKMNVSKEVVNIIEGIINQELNKNTQYEQEEFEINKCNILQNR